MQYLDATLPSPEENLALDEALLIEAEQGRGGEVLRFWESPTPFVVIGIGAKVDQEVHGDHCQARRIRVLRRCSGGGTVVQGPGCLSYALVLRIPGEGPLTTIRGTNEVIMHRTAAVLSTLTRSEILAQGHTDLAWDGIKVSGNAQRRLRHHLLFHGTFLLDFDLPLIGELLPLPRLQPGYRRNRPHAEFVRNLGVSAPQLKKALRHEWGASEDAMRIPSEQVARLVDERYGREKWNLRR
jgi:lipoate-protein ligase A